MNLTKEVKLGEPYRFAKALYQGKFPSYRHRPLTDDEIDVLKANHNFCEDWSQVQVENEFNPKRVRHSTFSGKVCLPSFFGNVLGPDGVPFPTGLYHTDVHNACIENCHISKVGLLANQVVSQSVILRKVGSISTLGLAQFGLGAEVLLGSEVGARLLPIYAEMNFEIIEEVLQLMGDRIEWKFFQESLAELNEMIKCDYGFIGKNAIISNTSCVRNSWIGDSTRIDGATKVQNSCILSALEQAASIKDGAIVEDSILQWGTKVKSNGYVKNSMLLEASSVAMGGKVIHSIIGSNSHIQQGEVSHCLLGPFVGFHHQSMLISVLWPEGMGNVGHGACIGSNHTGRKPNQELRPGKGMFFGLGSLVSYPGNYQGSPWSLVATGVHLPPQKVDFPMSLFAKGENGVDIVPGWVAGNNAYTLLRNEKKFEKRNQARRQEINTEVFDIALVQEVLNALKKLEEVPSIREVYSEKQIAGLGMCRLTEVSRQKGMKYYAQFLERCFYLLFVQNVEKNQSKLNSESGSKKVLTTDLLRELSKRFALPDHLLLAIKRFRSVEKNWLENAAKALEKEKKRGMAIHEDYLLANPDPLPMEDFLIQEYESAKARVRALLGYFKGGKS